MKFKYNRKNLIITKILTILTAFLLTWDVVNNNDEVVEERDLF